MIRNNSEQVGKLAIDAMELRTRKWRIRRDKDSTLKHSRVGSAVESVSNEKVECECTASCFGPCFLMLSS